MLRFRTQLSQVGWSTLDAVVGPILSVAVSPVLLNQLDGRGFGLWALAIAIAGFGGLASLGVGVATTKYVAEDQASGRSLDAVTTTRAALSVALTGGLLLLAVAVAFAPLLASTAFVRMGATGEVADALLLGVALLVLQEVDGVFTGALRGAQRFNLAAQCEIATRVAWVAIVVGTAWATHDAVHTLQASVAVAVVKVMIRGLAAQSALGGLCTVPGYAFAPILRVLRLGKWLWMQGLGGVLFSVVDRLVIGAIFGANDLARYSICTQLAQYVHGGQATALQPLIPWISARLASQHPISTASLMWIAFLGGLGCIAAPLLLGAIAEFILSTWISAEFAQNNSGLFRILLAAYGLLAFSIPVHYLLVGFGSVRSLAAVNVLAGFVSLGASALMSPWGFSYFVLGKLLFAPLILLNFVMLRASILRHQQKQARVD